MKQTRPINPLRWVIIGGGILLLLILFFPRSSSLPSLEISQVLQMAESGSVAKIQVQGDNLEITDTSGTRFRSQKESSVSVLELLAGRGVDIGADGVQLEVKSEGRSFGSVFLGFLPLIIIGGLVFWMVRRASKGGISQITNLGKSQAKLVVEQPTTSFADIAGVEEAKQELSEIVEFLKYPGKFAKLGAKVPRGVLLAGPPGTGKTLISRAVAGEAGVAFFSISGSEFVEMFVGVGAGRVRDLFSRARQQAPAIVFIDEIDAVGRQRGSGIGGGHDEREQTLNQILVEMDGFDERSNVIVIAATNRPDVLDPALLRPGRFDRKVVLELPDVRGREAILDIYLRNKPVLEGLDVHALAQETHGFSGAELANLVNEAAIMAARQERDTIGLPDLEEAIDRVIAGPAKRSRQVSEKEREIVAYHEAGHALVAANLGNADPVHKVTIVARGAAGGYTRTLPEEDRSLWSKGQFEAMMAVMMGGQVAEEMAIGDITTGASNDLEKASEVARRMVTEFGMSESLAPRTYGKGQQQVFLGKEFSQGPSYSDAVAEKIDSEIEGFLCKARETAKKALEANRARLTLLANRLLAEETIEGPELRRILADSDTESAPLAAD